MGIYDRDYYREQPSGFSLRGPRSIVGMLILINVAIYLADGLLTPVKQGHGLGDLNNFLALKADSLIKPWLWWQFVTYGFAHSSYDDLAHIAFNMLGLFFLGRDIESRYGRMEFLRLYLTLVTVGGLVFAASNYFRGADHSTVVGASGAVVGIVVLFALNFPRRTLLLWGIVPIPAWLLGVLLVVGDLVGAAGASSAPGLGNDKAPIAYGVHLAGAAFALLYYRFGWNLGRWTSSLPSLKRRPRLRIHDPGSEASPKRDNLSVEVDRILEKIHREGENSLTRKERRTMEDASRQYQKKHGNSGGES